jgi:hypothetical protein
MSGADVVSVVAIEHVDQQESAPTTCEHTLLAAVYLEHASVIDFERPFVLPGDLALLVLERLPLWHGAVALQHLVATRALMPVRLRWARVYFPGVERAVGRQLRESRGIGVGKYARNTREGGGEAVEDAIVIARVVAQALEGAHEVLGAQIEATRNRREDASDFGGDHRV